MNDYLLLTSFYALNAKVVELKKDQDRGPKTQKDQVLTPQKYTQIEEPGLKV